MATEFATTKSAMELAEDRLKNNPNISKVSEWSGNVRALDVITFEEGDEFTINGNEAIYEQKMPGASENADKPKFILVSVKNPKSQKEVVKNFYPSSLSKMAFEYDRATKQRLDRIVVDGTAVEFAQGYATIAELMQNLAGKTIRCSKLRPVYTLKYRAEGTSDKDYTTTAIPTWDLVNE